MLFKIFDRVICVFLWGIFWLGFIILRKINQCKQQIHKDKKKNILFFCSGQAYRYPKVKNNDFKLRWNKGFRCTLMHETFDRSYTLYMGDNNDCYKLCPGIITVVVKKFNFTKFIKISAVFNTVKFILVGYRLSKRIKFTMVETFLPGDSLIESVLVKKIINIPLVIQTPGDFDLAYFDEDLHKETYRKLLNRQIIKFIFSICLKNADLALGNNDHCVAFLTCNGASPHKVRQYRMHSFIEDFENYTVLPKNQLLKYQFDVPMIFLWCRLASEKKLKYAFEAMKKVFLSRPEVRLMVAGDGPLKEIFINQMHDYNKNVIFLGNLHRNELKSYIYHADVCMVPLGGHSLIEAAICKKAVVAFSWEWHGEVITNNHSGLLIDYPNIDEFKDAVLYFLNNPTKALEMGENLYNRVKYLFNYEAVICREQKIWKEFHNLKNAVL